MFNTSRILRMLSVGFAAGVLSPALLVFPVLAEETPVAQTVARETRCPVCGMYPARYPKWMAQLAFSDRTTQAFDSPLELFRFLNDVAKYDRRHKRSDVAAVFLTDYARGGWIEGKRAFLVAGSTARGPMNNADLPAFGSKDAAEQFAKANGGKALAFEQITPEILQSLVSPAHDPGRHEHHEHAGH